MKQCSDFLFFSFSLANSWIIESIQHWTGFSWRALTLVDTKLHKETLQTPGVPLRGIALCMNSNSAELWKMKFRRKITFYMTVDFFLLKAGCHSVSPDTHAIHTQVRSILLTGTMSPGPAGGPKRQPLAMKTSRPPTPADASGIVTQKPNHMLHSAHDRGAAGLPRNWAFPHRSAPHPEEKQSMCGGPWPHKFLLSFFFFLRTKLKFFPENTATKIYFSRVFVCVCECESDNLKGQLINKSP